jgi:hypothetical protein
MGVEEWLGDKEFDEGDDAEAELEKGDSMPSSWL